jgi:hypothetical protein
MKIYQYVSKLLSYFVMGRAWLLIGQARPMTVIAKQALRKMNHFYVDNCHYFCAIALTMQ